MIWPRSAGSFDADRLGELRGGARAVGEHVGDPEARRDVEQLRREVAVHDARELPLAGRGIGHRAILPAVSAGRTESSAAE